MNPFADKIHADRGADRRDIKSAESRNNRLQRVYDIVSCDDDFMVVGTDIRSDFARVFQINSVDVHTDRESFERLLHEPGGSSAHKRRIKTAGEQITDRRIGVQTLFNTAQKLVVNVFADFRKIVVQIPVHLGRIFVSMELASRVVASGRKRKNLRAGTDQVLRFGGENDCTFRVISVI